VRDQEVHLLDHIDPHFVLLVYNIGGTPWDCSCGYDCDLLDLLLLLKLRDE